MEKKKKQKKTKTREAEAEAEGWPSERSPNFGRKGPRWHEGSEKKSSQQ